MIITTETTEVSFQIEQNSLYTVVTCMGDFKG